MRVGLPATAAAAAIATAATAAATVSAAAAIATTTAAIATTAAAAAAAALLRFVHANVAAIEAGTVHLTDGLLRIAIIGEGHEAEAPRATGVAVGDDLGVSDVPVGGECGPESLVVGVPGEAANK